jgi:NAD(P)-dependent dehydrogenase (short-subunit alcohol dehydrogenase family)
VLVHYANSEGEAESVVQLIRSSGGSADKVSAELGEPDGAHRLAERVKELAGGRLDILVANAGISGATPIAEMEVADFDRLYNINVRAPYFIVQQTLPFMNSGDCIVFTSSLVARSAVLNLSAYAATKGAISTLVIQLAAELGPLGIRVNAVAPGVVDTDMSSFTKTEAGKARVLGLQALKRIAQPEDLGGAFAFLASPAAKWITGHTLYVDGGSKL